MCRIAKDELDLVILSHIDAHGSGQSECTEPRVLTERLVAHFYLHAQLICTTTFLSRDMDSNGGRKIALYIREHYVIREIRENFQVHGIYIYKIILYIYIYQDGGAVGFVDFTKLLFALSSLTQPLKRVRSIP